MSDGRFAWNGFSGYLSDQGLHLALQPSNLIFLSYFRFVLRCMCIFSTWSSIRHACPFSPIVNFANVAINRSLMKITLNGAHSYRLAFYSVLVWLRISRGIVSNNLACRINQPAISVSLFIAPSHCVICDLCYSLFEALSNVRALLIFPAWLCVCMCVCLGLSMCV